LVRARQWNGTVAVRARGAPGRRGRISVRPRTITVSRLVLAVAVVAVAIAAGRLGPILGPGSRRAARRDEPAAAGSTPARPGAAPNVANAFVDKSPPPEDEGPSRIDLRAYHYTTDQAIGLFEGRVERDPKDFVSLAMLGEAHALKARESGDPGGYERAEEALRKSLTQSPGYSRARTTLALVLCSRHRFAEGLALAAKVYDENPGNLNALATMGDAQLELGRYAEAEATYQKLLSASTEPSTLARMARLAELKGQTDEAVRLLHQAADDERKTGDAKAATWYQVRLGEISFDAGRLDDAEQTFRAVLQEFPDHHDSTADLGKMRAARGHYDEAIALLKKAAAIAAEPALLAVLGDLHARNGQEELAQRTFARLEQTALRYPEYRRELSLFYSQHDRQLQRALELARQDLEARPDIYGYDALAWALYKEGRPEEAAKAIAEALKLGTRDARLFYHAGMIYHRLGDRAGAGTWLGRALALNPHFSLRDAEEARRTLAASRP
jgi:tetratricopeptide (TPR) repeat protein